MNTGKVGMDTVLIVDDDPHVLSALARVLRRRGFRVRTALDGGEALALVDAEAPDAVIADFRLPGMNGAELLSEVRRRAPRAARLLLSGYADLSVVQPPVDLADVERLLRKPWDNDELVAALHEALRERDGASDGGSP